MRSIYFAIFLILQFFLFLLREPKTPFAANFTRLSNVPRTVVAISCLHLISCQKRVKIP